MQSWNSKRCRQSNPLGKALNQLKQSSCAVNLLQEQQIHILHLAAVLLSVLPVQL